MSDCIFCKIINGELPSSKLYEDSEVMAFLDINPTRPGHTLVVPKTHCTNFLDCDPEIGAKLMKAVQKVAGAVTKATGADSFNLGINNGRAAGQIIFHLHVHIIPRTQGDGLKPWGHGQYGQGEMDSMAEKIRAQL